MRRKIKTLEASTKDDFYYMKFSTPRGGNEQQMKFVREVKQTLVYDLKSTLADEFDEKTPPSFTSIVERGEALMNFRMKIIVFSEESSLGCGKVGHISANCYGRDTREKKRR